MEAHHLKTRRKDREATELICRECHQHIHGLFDNTMLRDPSLNLDSLEGLLESERFQKALTFIRKVLPGQKIRMRQSNDRRK